MTTAMQAVAFVGALFGLAVAVLWLSDRVTDAVRHRRRSPDQEAVEEAAFRSRRLQPKWDEVQRITGGRPSPELLTLYSSSALILRKEFSVKSESAAEDPDAQEFVSSFRPADGVALEDPWCEHLPPGSFPFATDFTGDLIFVTLTPGGSDSPVRHWYHDGGDIETVAPSLHAFLLHV